MDQTDILGKFGGFGEDEEIEEVYGEFVGEIGYVLMEELNLSKDMGVEVP